MTPTRVLARRKNRRNVRRAKAVPAATSARSAGKRLIRQLWLAGLGYSEKGTGYNAIGLHISPSGSGAFVEETNPDCRHRHALHRINVIVNCQVFEMHLS